MPLILNLAKSLYRNLCLLCLGVSNWSVGYPSEKHGIKFSQNGVLLQGWVRPLFKRCTHFNIIVTNSSDYEIVVPVDRSRPDVTGIENGLQPYFPGFRAWIPSALGVFDIYLERSSFRIKISSINLNKIGKTQRTVLETQPFAITGKDDWLYLGSDGNHSYLQALGMIRLTEKCRRAWKKYSDAIEELRSDNTKVALLVAPCKERVLPQYYSFNVSPYGLLNQIDIAKEILVYPQKELRHLADQSYIKTDTHWSHEGALCAFKALCLKLGIDQNVFDSTFRDDEWVEQKHIGDLGNKTSPPSHCIVMRNKTSHRNIASHKVFDNGMPNYSRVIVFKNTSTSSIDKKCLIFGSSSFYSIFPFAARMFSHVIFIHSAGNIDKKIIVSERPDYMITQSNERFMLRPANLEFDTQAYKERKAISGEIDFELVRKRQVIPDDLKYWNPLFKKLLVDIDSISS